MESGSVQVLGIIGALDPHTHKTNQADLQGEGKLEREGVRPQRQHHSAGGPQDDALGAPPQPRMRNSPADAFNCTFTLAGSTYAKRCASRSCSSHSLKPCRLDSATTVEQ